MTKNNDDHLQFFLTAPQPCAYLKDRFERKIFGYLSDDKATEYNSNLTKYGFRRSQNIIYRPVCEGCKACISVRILVDHFKLTASMSRVMKKNAHRVGTVCPAKATSEQYSLFKDYINSRHVDGGMSNMSALEYQMMVEESKTKTNIIEYRNQNTDNLIGRVSNEPLIAVALTDIIDDGLSMVYSFYDTNELNTSLGMFMILDHIQRAKTLGLSYVYLGYWVEGSAKMNYKARYQPQEHLTENGWVLK
ncbi:arginyltransferase [Bartonella tamiae]|uniref:Aspartate/glutamate leucyltransferase n=1 Tax=Bartonella tamiae Th239 TaxID=1094558 RepID=J0ZKN8_9HYPH|nr:arginyltransferase [Bartonella tamiae]EJF88898.1 hypothetical protein ME5_01449 [Bartonella tamiae Th239]EJF94852.1 hypothetical protein MEG_00433 [Bartonella tamiae Th307]